jgi:hypothetical protein
MRRHRILQANAIERWAALAIVPDEMAAVSVAGAVVPTTKLQTVLWTLLRAGRIDYVPSFAEVLADPTIDDVAAVRAITSAIIGPRLNDLTPLVVL